MNHITVVACGMDGSPVRRVQQDPRLAIDLYIALKWILKDLDAGVPVTAASLLQAKASMREFLGDGSMDDEQDIVSRLRADLLACSTRLAACAEVLGRAAERGKVCAKCKEGKPT